MPLRIGAGEEGRAGRWHIQFNSQMGSTHLHFEREFYGPWIVLLGLDELELLSSYSSREIYSRKAKNPLGIPQNFTYLKS